MPDSFDQSTQRFFKQVQTLSYAQNQTQYAKLLNIGYLANINMILTISFTVANGAGSTTIKTGRGKTTGNPTPFDIIKNIKFTNNQNVPLIDMSLWGLYLWTNTQRTAYNAQSLRNQTGLSTGLFGTPTTSTLANGAVTWRIPIQIPIAQKPLLQNGLILMQNQQTNMQVEITWGDTANLVTVAGGASIGTPSVSLDIEQEYFMVPADPASQPNLSLVHRILETTQDITGTGQQDYRPPLSTSDTLVRLLQEFGNNNTFLAGTDITSHECILSGATYIWSRSPYQILAQNVRDQGGNYNADGAYSFALDNGYGFPEIATGRDVLDLGGLSDLTFRLNVAPSATLVGAYMRNIREYLSK